MQSIDHLETNNPDSKKSLGFIWVMIGVVCYKTLLACYIGPTLKFLQLKYGCWPYNSAPTGIVLLVGPTVI